MTDIFSEDLSPEFIKNLIGERYDFNCSYCLVTTPTGGFEVMAHNNATDQDICILSQSEMADFSSDKLVAEEEQEAIIKSSEDLDTVPRISSIGFTLIFGFIIVLSLFVLYFMVTGDLATIGERIQEFLQSLIQRR